MRVAFALDCCDREAIGHVATTGGINAENVQDLLVASVEHRFASVNRLSKLMEWLSDNGNFNTGRDIRAFAREIGLVSCTTPMSSPQSNCMTDAQLDRAWHDMAGLRESRLRLKTNVSRYNDVIGLKCELPISALV
ncbi:MAG: hypothetical protein EOO77_27150 [Oxalobacteraceae bacterium]|nr:MAG: hypothetical protein EOO77_27150 [Oxalobacteraceae bacterium]